MTQSASAKAKSSATLVPTTSGNPKKTYILDTNVLIHDPSSYARFAEHNVVIPYTVIEELDKKKRESGNVAKSAREVVRALDSLRSAGSLSEGVPLPNSGGMLFVRTYDKLLQFTLPKDMDENVPDNMILAATMTEQKRNNAGPTILVSNDGIMRIKADTLGILSEIYRNDRINLSLLPSGITEMPVSVKTLDTFHGSGTLKVPDLSTPNRHVLLYTEKQGNSNGILVRYDSEKKVVSRIKNLPDKGVFGIKARNIEQATSLDLLCDPNIQLITMVGCAGTGKTLLALAAGLQQSIEESIYNKVIASRPVFPMGRDLGYLPGDIKEKLAPWMQPIRDAGNILFSTGDKKKKNESRFLEYMGYLEMEPLVYIRGRSIPQQFMIIDEAQNLTPHEVKTIITRAGEGTKIILAGDPYQIDNPYVDKESNGLTYVAQRFQGHTLSGHITLLTCERSPLAAAGAALL